MQKFLKTLTVSVALVLLTFGTGMAEKPQFEPLSPRYLEWLEKQKSSSSSKSLTKSGTAQTRYNGYIPFHIDLSHLAKNPPIENSASNSKKLTKATSIPTKYDLRDVSCLTSVKNQGSYGTCWAHASIGAIESNLLKQNLETYDLSEMHLSWFTFRNSDKSKAFDDENSSSFQDVMDHGGNAFYPTALFARLAGPVNESTVPYPTRPSASTPESYNMAGVRLREVYYLAFDDINVNSSSAQRNIIKQRIMDNGSVLASYCDNQSNNKENYNKTSNGTAYYYDSTSINHAVQIVGWDDNFSRNNFKTKPSVDGAWLIKNSWGTSFGDNGYFWMSYAQHLEDGTAFIAERFDSSMKVYDYSPLGWCGTWGWTATSIHSANVFKSERDNEKLTEVGFYTPDNNINYQIKVYTGMTSMPSSTPVKGNPVSTMSGTIAYAGWHTVTLNTPVSLTKNQYFSVVVTYTNYNMAPVEKKCEMAPNAVIDTGSFFSYDGTSWVTEKSFEANATIKAYTTTSSTPVTGTAPTITTSSLPSGRAGQSYSQTLSASGSTPITWSVSSGSLPTGLTLSSVGLLSGTPTASGSFTFTVKAANSYGTDLKSYTLSITSSSTPTPTPGSDVNLTGYVGYSLSYQMTPAGTWTRTSGTLPSGISLSRSGLLSGRPSRAGSYSVTLKCTTTASSTRSKSSKNTKSSTVTVNVKFTINAKPVKPTIKTSSLAVGVVGTAYSQAITATGTAPITLTVTGLPAGLSFNQSTGYITGTPTTPGTSTITIKAENLATTLDRSTVTKSLRLTIKARPPVIADPGTLPDGIVKTAYRSVQFRVSEGTAPITWSASGLPAGLRMSTSGLLSGTPTKAGTFTMTVKASNSGGNATRKVQVKVIEKPAVSSAKMSNGTTDKSYTARFTAKGTTPITWTFTGLPDTMSFTQNSTGSTATVTGIPTTPGTFTIRMTLRNAAGSTSYAVTFTVKGVAPKLTASLSSARVGQSYTGSRISATGTKPVNISYSIAASDLRRLGISGLDELGLTFTSDSESGTASITGTPAISIKSLPITFTARNSVSTVTKRVTLTIVGNKPVFTSPSASTVNRTVKINSAVTVNFQVTGSKKITYSMNSVSGFRLSQTGDYTAVLRGNAPNRDATTTITVTAANADGKATRKIVIKSQTPPKITTASLPSGTLNKNYSTKVAATGTKTIRWELSGGTLPTGVRFSNGSFSGKPTAAGRFTFTLKAVNSVGENSKSFTITITDPNAKSSSKSSSSTKSLTTAQNTLKPTVTFGKTKAISSKTEAELEAQGYLIAAVLPELSVNVSGMYDIDVELYDDIPEGAELVWLAFPEKGKESDDDEIAEFYDEDGKEITRVPKNLKITVAPWLNKGIKYSPVIAVK